MDLLNLLTTKDIEKIDRLRMAYTTGEIYNFCSTKKFLIPWAEQKSQHLKSLFGNKLIVREHINYEESLDELKLKIEQLFEDERILDFEKEFRHTYENKAGYNHVIWYSLFNYEYLATNKLGMEFDTQAVLADGKKFKITRGMKPIKIISKIAKSYKIGTASGPDGISNLEYFRRQHSMCLNQKSLEGDLCLSIHPLDYMTMSDNDMNWSSCMSWENYGDYRQGTVEMMNSVYAVVGYLTPKGASYYSKKWRCLFLVDPSGHFIVSVKSYPYYNETLTKACMERLAAMSGWVNPQIIECETDDDVFEGKRLDGYTFRLQFSTDTGAMYNDFGTTTHFVIVNPEIKRDIDEWINYCGPSECVWCGNTDFPISAEENPASLSCTICEPVEECWDCGCHRNPDDMYTTADGYRLCSNCYDNCMMDDITNEVYWNEDSVRSIILLRHNNSANPSTRGPHECITVCRDFVVDEEQYTKYFKHIYQFNSKDYPWFTDRYYVLPQDCTPEALKFFGIENHKQLEVYMKSYFEAV